MLKRIEEYYVFPNSKLEDVVKEAIEIAKKNDCLVKIKFNGIELLISEKDNVEDIKCDYFKRFAVKFRKKR